MEKSSGETKIGQLKLIVLAHENILWFQIPVHNSMQMALMNPAQNLVEVFFDNVWAKNTISWIVSPVSDGVAQVTIAVLEHQVDLIDLWNDIQKFNQVWMVNLVKFLQS